MLYCVIDPCVVRLVFFFNDTATTEIYTLSLHDALPISTISRYNNGATNRSGLTVSDIIKRARDGDVKDRKSTRLNSSHQIISYAVFCLKKKKIYSKHIMCRIASTDWS